MDMKLSRLSKRNKRAVFILGGFLLAYVAIFHLFLPFLDRQRAIDGQIASKRQEVQRYLKALELEPEYRRHIEAVRSTVKAYEERLLQAPDVNTAALQIEETVRALAGQSGIRVTRSNPLPERMIGETYAKIGIQLNLEGDYDSVIGFVHSISAHEKFLLVEEFQLTSFRVRDETRLQPRLKIAGFIRLS
jgi:Tfp pilus assembly protein PilO